MVRYNIDDVTDDMLLAESIFLQSGELLLAAGFRLTERYRSRLKKLGFTTVGIQVDGTEDVTPEDVISKHVQHEVRTALNQQTKELKNVLRVRREGVQNFRQMLRQNKQHLNKFLSAGGLSRTIEKMIDDILNQPSVVLNMEELSKSDSDLFSHAINVATTSLCIGRKFHFSYDEMKQLAMGAINYDMGLMAVPQELHEKNYDFTEEEWDAYRQHTVYGYLILSQNPAIAATSAAVALQHHEHQDGSGYPRGIMGENRPPLKDFSRKKVIHRFAEIVAVADTYDMLISGRLGHTRLSVRDAMKKIIELGGDVLNIHIVKTLISIIPVFPVGARIRVASSPAPALVGYYGVVAKDNVEDLERPQIILYETKKHQKVKPILIDLAKYQGFEMELIV